MRKYECWHCEDIPCLIDDVDSAIGIYVLNWECHFCYEVLDTKKWTRRYANYMVVKMRIKMLIQPVKRFVHSLAHGRPVITEGDDIPF